VLNGVPYYPFKEFEVSKEVAKGIFDRPNINKFFENSYKEEIKEVKKTIDESPKPKKEKKYESKKNYKW